MENLIQYGPYSPQDIVRITPWLQKQNIQFEIIRNDQEANEALMNDGQNLVNLADLRTGIYLAQVFYINLKDPSDLVKKDFEDLFCMKDEVFHSQKQLEVNDEQRLSGDSLKNHRKKRAWAVFLSMLLIVQVVIAFYSILKREI